MNMYKCTTYELWTNLTNARNLYILFSVNEEIASTQAKTAEIRDELQSLQGNLAIQNNKIAEQELQLKWRKEREKIMNVQKQHLEETKLKLQNTFVRSTLF